MSDPQAQPDPEERPLTVKQRRFIEAYCGEARFNKSAAARIAGYSPRSARDIGSELFRDPRIKARIDARLEQESLRDLEVIHELTNVAMRGLDEMVEVRRFGEELSAKMDAHAKMKALELLGKHYKLFTEKVDHGGEVGTVVIREIRVPRPDGDA